MGLCVSADSAAMPSPEERLKNTRIAEELQKDKATDSKVKKLLLLGPGQSGKTTFYRQLVNLYGEKYDTDRLLTFKPIIHTNVISSLRKLCEMSDVLGKSIPGCRVDPKNLAFKEEMAKYSDDREIDVSMVEMLKALWNDSGIQTTFDNRAKFQLIDSVEYFMKKIEVIASPDYLPSLDDVLRSRAQTTGIVETEFEVDGTQFFMIDVGGQRNERKKWIHCFEGVTSVIFVAALSEYDQFLYEDETVNRMDEALNLFKDTMNYEWFRQTDIILFLNKSDLFREKIKKVPITVYWKDYSGEMDYASCIAFIEEEFRSRIDDLHKELYIHVTCATDTTQVNFTFNAVKNILIRKGLTDAGILH